ncbi:helix-turn-helix transcriptional regulator [Luteimonas marina]|uniref:Helix-turn-helix transcriptional regulator n=1 Tax=Luteimonas marina TaxID=488485 RepID=A0A5C5UD29_9GAMM|nr:helix-turn-helix transcriptional regulator [Luteimonas marina]TWT23623.1 helix-turn-helix transcriptional regulator [Luteimonas marina]
MTGKTIYSAEYRRLVERLRARREEIGLTQTALSKDLGWPQQRLSAIEAGARRLDVMEFLHLTARLGLAPDVALRLVVAASESPGRRKKAPDPK